MDGNRFDALAKTLIAATNRRQTLGALLGGALAARGLAAPDDAAAARSRRCKRKPGECEVCKKGKCKNKNGKKKCKAGKITPKANGTACTNPRGNATCQNGTCTCPRGLTACSGVCTDVQADEANCGTCGTVCRGDQPCQNGTCACPPGTEDCPAQARCVALCAPGAQARNRNNCTCCFVNSLPCTNTTPEGARVPQPNATCCSQLCLPVGASGAGGVCSPGVTGSPCNVGANCGSGNCVNGQCAA